MGDGGAGGTKEPVGNPPVGAGPPVGNPPVGKPPVGAGPPVGKPPVGKPPVGAGPPVGNPPVGKPPVGKPPVGNPPVGTGGSPVAVGACASGAALTRLRVLARQPEREKSYIPSGEQDCED